VFIKNILFLLIENDMMQNNKRNIVTREKDSFIEKENGLPLPWQLRDNEPIEAYSAFEFYLSLGNHRSLKNAAARLKLSLDKLKTWSRNWEWNKRARIHDAIKMEVVINKELTEIEIRNKEVEKLRLRFSLLSKRALIDLMGDLENFWENYNNRELKAKISHVSRLTTAVNNLINFAHIELSPENQILLSNRNIKINNVLNLKNDILSIKNEKTNIYNFVDLEEEMPPVPHKKFGQEFPLPKLPPELM